MDEKIEDLYKKYKEINAIINNKTEEKDKVHSSLLKSKAGKLYFSLNDEQKELFESIYRDVDFSRYLYLRDDIKEYKEKLSGLSIDIITHKDFPFRTKETQYQNVVSDWQSWQDDGTNVFRVLVYSVPMMLSLIGFKIIRRADDPVINICVNMSIVTTGLYIISMFTSGVYIGRLPIYFSLYNYILLPWEINHIFTERSKRLIYILMIGAYLVFYYYQMHFAWSML